MPSFVTGNIFALVAVAYNTTPVRVGLLPCAEHHEAVRFEKSGKDRESRAPSEGRRNETHAAWSTPKRGRKPWLGGYRAWTESQPRHRNVRPTGTIIYNSNKSIVATRGGVAAERSLAGAPQNRVSPERPSTAIITRIEPTSIAGSYILYHCCCFVPNWP